MAFKLKKYSKYAFIVIFLIVLYFTFLLIKPFVTSIIASLLLVYILYPAYRWLNYFVKNSNVSSALMLVFVSFMILIPLAFIVNALINESLSMYARLDISKISEIVSVYTTGKIGPYMDQVLEKAASYLVEITSGMVMALPKKLLSLVVIAFVAFFGFRDGEVWLGYLGKVLPLKKKYTSKVSQKFSDTINGIVYGTITISILEGLVAIPAFYIFDVSSPFLWGFVMVILSMFPAIGPATVWIPIVIVKLFYGDMWDAIGLALYCAIIVNLLIEFMLKQKFISGKTKVHPIIIFIGVLGGLNIFGLVGVIVGPLIIALATLFAEFYLESK